MWQIKIGLLKDHRKVGGEGGGVKGGMQGGMEGRQTVWLSFCICNERERGGRQLQTVTRLMLYCLSDSNEWVKTYVTFIFNLPLQYLE